MVSLGHAHRLKLKYKFDKPISVSGLGGVPTSITASAEVKITLGPRVVCVVDIWVASIGGGLDVLLGMNFMFSAGVRLCVKKGLVQLPDEDMAHGIGPKYTMYLKPGPVLKVNAAVDRMGWKRRSVGQPVPATIKVGNVSDSIVTIDWRTEVAQVVKNGFFPRAGCYVRVGIRRYQEWQTLMYENTISAKAQVRESPRLDDLQKMEPPAVQTPTYPWPTRMMVRPPPGREEARVINFQIVASEVHDETSERSSMRRSRIDTSVPEVSEMSEVEDDTTDISIGDLEEVPEDQDSDEDEVFASISVDDGFPEVSLEDIPNVEPEDDV
ncbi:LOW QUALITY PROTEIN: hypothetical protein PHMEG_00026090 [Phytophthora megakarya]|uniref:Aspartic protease n=1 Tax=Phytophthora megakarya TaxID=4795 RepID=A0A225VA24_9STRA|nr:LOW QUALITY PROTEIN: hypothetical protein PHMEG_00026090 [Phytophthora megakarya]